jgi:hypothetical protein
MFTTLSHSEPGGHAHNEDAFLVQAHPADADCLLCAVADGQGGQPGGGAAAELACRACIEAACAIPPDRLFGPGAWAGLGRTADEAVAADHAAGYTTLVALAVRGNALVGASSGDSAAVLCNGGKPGVILTARQLKNPPVGSGLAVFVEFDALLEAPWTVLALTDGVWKYAGWEAVLGAANETGDVVKELRRRATLPGSGRLQDDFTVVLVRPGA